MQIITKEKLEHYKRNPAIGNEVRDKYEPMQLLMYKESEQERSKRQKDIEEGIIPF